MDIIAYELYIASVCIAKGEQHKDWEQKVCLSSRTEF